MFSSADLSLSFAEVSLKIVSQACHLAGRATSMSMVSSIVVCSFLFAGLRPRLAIGDDPGSALRFEPAAGDGDSFGCDGLDCG